MKPVFLLSHRGLLLGEIDAILEGHERSRSREGGRSHEWVRVHDGIGSFDAR